MNNEKALKREKIDTDRFSDRVIIHIDMDAFFAAVEERDAPQLAGQPVIVGGAPESRGVVATCNYVARKYGIHSAMASAQAYKRCPQGIFIRPRFDVYRQVSAQVQSIFYDYTELVEPVSIDEAYLDVTAYVQQHACSPITLARTIKQRIQSLTQLTASAGISYNKFLAKLASDMDKPDGLHLISEEEGKAFVTALPIEKFHGVGKATQKKMNRLNIYCGKDLQAWSLEKLVATFGKVGNYYYHVCRGIDRRLVTPNRVRKSVGAEKTFEQDVHDTEAMMVALKERARKVAEILAQRKITGKTVTIKVKFSDFQQVTRSHTLPLPLGSLHDVYQLLPALLDKALIAGKPVRLLGVTVSGLCQSTRTQNQESSQQLTLL